MQVYFDKQIFNIILKRHIFENRKGTSFARGEKLNESRYKEIFKYALINGLRSLRNLAVVIKVQSITGTYFSILCKLIDNQIHVISVYIKNNCNFKAFIKVNERIFINYKLPIMSNDELEKAYIKKMKVKYNVN